MREHEIYRQGPSASDNILLFSRKICSLLQSKPKGGTMDCKPRESRNTSVFHAVLTMTKTRTQLKFHYKNYGWKDEYQNLSIILIFNKDITAIQRGEREVFPMKF